MDSIDRPGSVTAFLWLWTLVILLTIVAFLSVASELRGADVAIGIVSNIIQIILVVLCAQRRNWARWVLAILFAIGLVFFLTQVGAVFAYSAFLGVVNLASYVAGGIGLVLVFTSSATDWYQSRPVPVVAPEVAAARRRTMIRAASAVGVLAAIGVGYLIWNPDLTDWEPIRARCFSEDEAIALRDRIAACDEMTESERFEGPELAAIHMRAGDLQVERGMNASASGEYQDAASAEPTNLDAWRNLGRTRLDGGYPGLAVSALERALELAPDDAALHLMLGQALFLSDRFEEALPALETAVATAPDSSAETYAYLAAANNRLGHYEAALDAIGSALALEPDNASYHVVYGDALAYAGRHDEALESYRRVNELVPDAIDGLLGMATSHCAMGATEEARGYLDRMFAENMIREIHLQNLMVSAGAMDAVDDDIAAAALWSNEIGPQTEAALQTWMAQGCPMPPPATTG